MSDTEKKINALEKAEHELQDAVDNVAFAAQIVAANVIEGDNYLSKTVEVNREDMNELKDALKIWKQATQNFLEVLKKVGE
jgi:hypothetical protein